MCLNSKLHTKLIHGLRYSLAVIYWGPKCIAVGGSAPVLMARPSTLTDGDKPTFYCRADAARIDCLANASTVERTSVATFLRHNNTNLGNHETRYLFLKPRVECHQCRQTTSATIMPTTVVVLSSSDCSGL